MAAYAVVATLITDAMGFAYDSEFQDAGFASEAEAKFVAAFKYVAATDGDKCLCPTPTVPGASAPCVGSGCMLFQGPWSVRASAEA